MNNETYYLDANALLRYYKEEQGSDKIRELIDNKDKKIWISKLTLLECCAVLFKYLRSAKNSVEQEIMLLALSNFAKNLNEEFFKVKPFNSNSFDDALDLVLKYGRNFQFGSLDALHAAIVKNTHETTKIVTSDGGKKTESKGKLIGLCNELGISAFNPETQI
jgi:predicted nucleic acid-binding protein